MNVYDWDNTIYRGDSTFGLVLYAYRKRPKSLLSLPRTLWCGLLYVLHIKPKLWFKENLYHMFTFFPDMENFVDDYTASHLDRVKDWYKLQQKEDDVVISASPEFLISSFCKKVGIKTVMASKVDIQTGSMMDLIVMGKKKVRRFYELYPNTVIDEFYSDSRSDDPLAKISKQAYLVKGNERKEW